MRLTLLLVAISFFILNYPISILADSWYMPDRVRLNLKISGSSGDPALGTKTLKSKSYAGTSIDGSQYGISDGTVIASASAKDEKDTQTVGGLTLHYVMKMGMVVGIHRHTNKFDTIATQKSDWSGTTISGDLSGGLFGAGVANTLNGGVSSNGTLLGNRSSSGYVNFLDLGYFHDFDGISVSGGIGLPLLGAGSETKIAYTAAGQTLNGAVANENIEPDKGSIGDALTFFVDGGYAFGSYEATFGFRKVTTKSVATVSKTKGLGKILDDTKFTSDGDHNIFSIGFGYIF